MSLILEVTRRERVHPAEAAAFALAAVAGARNRQLSNARLRGERSLAKQGSSHYIFSSIRQRLALAGGRNDSIHSQVLDNLSIFISNMDNAECDSAEAAACWSGLGVSGS